MFKINRDMQWRRRHDKIAVLCGDCTETKGDCRLQCKNPKDLYNGASFQNVFGGLDKAIERVMLEITKKQNEIARYNQAIQDCNNRISQLHSEIASIERAEQEAREAAAREAAAREAARTAAVNTSKKK